MPDIKRVGDDGIHTVEGVVAGEAAAEFSRIREQQREEYERAKNKIKQKNATGVVNMQQKFSTGSDSLDDSFRAATVGLVTADEFRRARETIDEMKHKQLDNKVTDEEEEEKNRVAAKRKRAEERKKQRMSHVLSFGEEEDSDEVPIVNSKKRVGGIKNPDADTTFLADRGRVAQEEEEERQRALAEQQRIEEIKKERVTVQYSYFDGKRHRRAMEIVKGMKIGRFVELAKLQLVEDFPELRAISSDALLYVKDDWIIPHHISFYDIITAKNSSNQSVFRFDGLDTQKRHVDARIPGEDVHAGKVVNRRWYEKNKHIFPASKWEVFELPKLTSK